MEILRSCWANNKLRLNFSFLVKSFICLSVLLFSSYHAEARAQVPVVRESTEVSISELDRNSRSDQNMVGSAGAANELWLLMEEIELLQQETKILRGMVEDQGHLIDRLSKRQQQHYLDLDARLQRLGGQSSSLPLSDDSLTEDNQSHTPDDAKQPLASTRGVPALSQSSDLAAKVEAAATKEETSPDTNTRVGSLDTIPLEKDLYQSALENIKNRDYAAAKQGLEQVLKIYPDGFYQAYARYWLGEIHLALPVPDYTAAISNFRWVVDNEPEHRKTAASYYKLGTLLDAVGDADQARSYLQKLLAQFPGSPEAKQAKKYLSKIQ